MLFVSALPAHGANTPKKKSNWMTTLEKSSSASNEPTPVAGVRGLEETEAEIDTSLRDYEALGRMQKAKAPEREVLRFVKEGNLR